MSLQNFIHNDPVQAQLQYAILLSCSIDERHYGEMSMALGKCFIGFDDDVRCSLYATDVIYRHHAHRIHGRRRHSKGRYGHGRTAFRNTVATNGLMSNYFLCSTVYGRPME